MTTVAPFEHGCRYWTKVHRDRDGFVRLMAGQAIDVGVVVAGRGRHDGGILVVIGVPPGSIPLPNQPAGVARMRLPTGDVLVARQRDTDPDGPWALSVERAVDAERRERLRLLSERDARVGDWAYEEARAAARAPADAPLASLIVCATRLANWLQLTLEERRHRRRIDVSCAAVGDGGCGALPGWSCRSRTVSQRFSQQIRAMLALGGETIVVRLSDDEREIRSVHIAGEALGPSMWGRCRAGGLPMGDWPGVTAVEG